MHRRRSLGEVSVDRSRVGPGLRSPRCGPVPTRLFTYTRTRARERAAASSAYRHERTRALALHLADKRASPERAHLVSAKGPNCVRAYTRARARADACLRVCVRERHAPGFAVCSPGEVHRPPSLRQGQRKYSLARFVRSPRPLFLCSSLPPLFLSFSLFLFISFYRVCRALRPAHPLAQQPLRLGSRSLFSVSVTPPKGPLPRVPFLLRAILHFDCIALPRERRLR